MSDQLSRQEATQYDRQIRVWGRNTQSRLRSSAVLLVGMGGINCEVGKNLTLSGVGRLVVLDDAVVEPRDLGANFLVDSQHLGKKRGEACIAALQELNPLVEVRACEHTRQQLDAATAKQYALVIATNARPEAEVEMDKACRSAGVPFLSSHSLGTQAILFVNLHSFSFKDDKKREEGAEEPAPVALVYPALADVFALPWGKLSKVNRVSKLWLAFDADSRAALSGQDPAACYRDLVEASNLSQALVSEDQLTVARRMRGVELSAVCAVVGGIIGQEVVKVIAQVGRPIHNVFCFDANTGRGCVESIAC